MADKQSNFEFLSSYCQSTLNIEKYQSKRTGMKFYHIQLPLPLIKLEICVQTKPYDDTGCAHTLEHLIFLGSEKYPQQGYLDYISAQHYSLGTNATTYRDMTTYELTTVNQKSLSTLLPVYLDHIFNPLLTNDCYLTEIHHISGETGEDAGVVYSEMQASENQPEEILLFSALRHLWSDQCPYYYECGGRLESIRNELTLDKIKVFHQKFYKPTNVAVILCGGGINSQEILDILDRFEQENFFFNENQRKKTKLTNEKFPFIQINQASFDENSVSSDTFTKTNPISIDTNKLMAQITTNDGGDSSFVDSENFVSNGDLSLPSSPSSLHPSIEIDTSVLSRHMNEYKEVCYPAEDNDENLGQVAFGYRLESIYEMEIYTALDVLLTTLFDDDISIFYKEFLELPNTLCSSIDHDWFNYPERVLLIVFEGVEVDNLTLVADKYFSTLYSILNLQYNQDEFLVQLKRNIQKKIQLHLNELEIDPYSYLTDLCCLDHISELSTKTSNEQHLDKFFQNKIYLEHLLTQNATYWFDLIRKYLLEWDTNKRTIVLLKPSNDLLLEQQEQDEQRIQQRLQTFGKIGREKLRQQLEQAKENNRKSSEECASLTSLSIEYNQQLHLPPIEHYSQQPSIDLYHSPTSHFNKYVLHIPINDLPENLQIYLPLFSNLLFHTSIQHQTIELTKYQFCQLMTRDILAYSVSNGQSSSSPLQSSYVHTHRMNTFTISLESLNTLEMYENTINYLRYALFGTVFSDFSIIIEECEKQLKNFIEAVQDGHTVHQAYFNSLLNSNESKHYYHQMNMFVQKKFFEKVCKQPTKYENDIRMKLQAIQKFLLKNLDNLHLNICGDIKLVKDNYRIIEEFLDEAKCQSQIEFEIKSSPTKPLSIYSPVTILGNQHEESG